MSSKTSTLLCSSGIFIFLLLLAGALYYSLILSSPFPLNNVYYASDIPLGLAFSDEEDKVAALYSIHRIRRELANYSWSFTPNLEPVNVSADSLADYLTASKDLKFFFGYSDEELKDLEPVAHKDSVFISPFAHFSHGPLTLIRNNLGVELLSKAYKAYFEAYQRGTKTAIICVLSPEDTLALEFYEHLKAHKSQSLEVSLPVFFMQNSSFPSSDAWQIVSDIGSKLAWAKRPYIFFLSDPSNVIPYLTQIVKTHPEIAEHPWVLRTPISKPWSGLQSLVNQVGLLSISYFALGDDETNLERRAQCLEDGIQAEKCHVYESLMRFHLSASKAIQYKTSLESAYEREGFESAESRSLMSGILAVRSGDGKTHDLIKIHNGNISGVIVVKESHLSRDEVSKWAGNTSRIEIFLEPGILLPYSHLVFVSFEDFPPHLSIPQTREETEFGLHLKLLIDTNTSCACVPNKLDHGEYVCDLSESAMVQPEDALPKANASSTI